MFLSRAITRYRALVRRFHFPRKAQHFCICALAYLLLRPPPFDNGLEELTPDAALAKELLNQARHQPFLNDCVEHRVWNLLGRIEDQHCVCTSPGSPLFIRWFLVWLSCTSFLVHSANPNAASDNTVEFTDATM